MRSLCIYGPPGTGKTTRQLHYYEKFLESGFKPSDIGFLSHTKAAAQEVMSRVKHKPREVSTIHSLAFRMCNLSREQVLSNEAMVEFGDKLGIPVSNKSMDSEEGIELGDELLAIYNLSVSRGTDPIAEYRNSHRPADESTFKYFYQSYEGMKKQFGYIDFNDMLRMYADNPIDTGLSVLMIDEAQDLTPLQWRVVYAMAKNVRAIVVSGDDDQSIYTWGGADPKGMVEFEKAFGSKREILEQSWRIPHKVHDVANRLISRIPSRVSKVYWPRTGFEGTVAEFGGLDEVDFSKPDTLILYRNHSIRKNEIEPHLISNRIKYVAKSGFPGLCQNKYYKAIEAWHALRRGTTISPAAVRAMEAVSRANVRPSISKGDFSKILSMDWDSVFSVPYFMEGYYHDIDFLEEPKVSISSIHASKGHEADNVILHTGMTNRTYSAYSNDPDSEVRVFYVGVTRAKTNLSIVHGSNGFPI